MMKDTDTYLDDTELMQLILETENEVQNRAPEYLSGMITRRIALEEVSARRKLLSYSIRVAFPVAACLALLVFAPPDGEPVKWQQTTIEQARREGERELERQRQKVERASATRNALHDINRAVAGLLGVYDGQDADEWSADAVRKEELQ